jgi:8-amino-7-oxononanoate synthase
MAPAGWDQWVTSELAAVGESGRRRRLRPLDGPGPTVRAGDGTRLVSFASNDYLGLSSHPAVAAAAAEAARRVGTGAGSSRLIVGDRFLHHELEAALADWRGAEAALVFASGYQANVAVLTTFGASGATRIVSDELNHASIIDGARLARAEVTVYRHGDVDHAAELVRSAPGPVLVVTDSVFSMDGDIAPLAELSRLCAETGALLVADDAHAVGPLPGVDPAAPSLRVGTLSKALGSQGGFVVGPRSYMDLLVNRARPFIFSTGLSPMAVAAALAALAVVRSPEGQCLHRRLRAHIEALRPGHLTPILPVVLGSEQAALDASAALLRRGLLVPAIRPPTVPPGTSRLRVSLSAAHRPEEVARLAAALDGLGAGTGPAAAAGVTSRG